MNHNQTIGKFGEDLAKNYLIRHGYEIIKANVKLSYLELDIVARKDNLTVFVEVKTRLNQFYGPAEDAFAPGKAERFKRGLQNYLFEHKLSIEDFRADLIAIDLDREKKIAKLKHFKDVI